MLRISIPSNGPSKINFSSFMNYLLPVPPKGIDSEVNNDAVLLFDNEQEAIKYADSLKQLPGSQKKVGNEIVNTIMRLARR
ncbi:hypothetical protein [Mucilaginibacter sp.]